MAIVISGVNNNDKITASDGTIDLLSGVSYSGIITAPAFTTPGNLTAGHINVGSNIQLGNAGVATATTFVGNLTGNINNTTLLLQTGGYERVRIKSDGKVGVNTTSPLQQFTSYAASGYSVLANGPSNGIGLGSNGIIVFGTKDLGSYASGAIDASDFVIKTSATERLRITSDGEIKVNTGSGTQGLHFQASSGANANLRGVGTNYGELGFFIGNTEKVRLDSNGRLLVGTTSTNAAVRAVFQGYHGGGDNFQARVQFQTNQATNLSTNQHLANLLFTNSSGSVGAEIRAIADNAWGTNDYPGRLEFYTTPDGSNTSTERVRIDSNGNTTFYSTGHIVLPSGTTAQRVNTAGALRFNSSLGNLEFYDGSSWKRVRLLEAAPTSGLLAYWPFSTASRSGTTYNDQSGNNHHLTVNGTITDDTSETKFNGCIDFGSADGNHYLRSSSNSFVNIGTSSGYSGVSISVWVKTSGTQNQWIISEGTVNQRWNYFNESANAPKWRSTNGGDVIQSGSILTGNWHHLVVTYNSSNNLVQHYRDGSFINSGTTTNPSFNGEYLLVGQHSSLLGNSASYRWRGKMAHMRIYNRVLTSSEVSTLYQQW